MNFVNNNDQHTREVFVNAVDDDDDNVLGKVFMRSKYHDDDEMRQVFVRRWNQLNKVFRASGGHR